MLDLKQYVPKKGKLFAISSLIKTNINRRKKTYGEHKPSKENISSSLKNNT